MSPEQVRGKTAKALFLAAAQLSPEERAVFLRPTEERDPELAAEVLELLRYDEGTDDLLDRPILSALEIDLPAPAPGLPEGTLLAGRYRIDGPLGSGASTDVYLGRDELLMGKNVAVKLLRHSASGSSFFREMEALARINHPGVMQVLDLGETGDGNSFLVTQYTPGRTLRSVLALQALPHDRVLRLIRQVGQALSAAHAQGVWHLDLKPDNILVVDFDSPDERIRIIDFGLAGMADAPTRTVVGGSPAYLAPEQVTGNASAAADQYSLAAIAVEMLAGRPPGLHRTVHALFAENCPAVSGAAVGVLARALAPNPAARFGSVGEFLSALTPALTAPRRAVPRWIPAMAAAAAALAVGLAAGVLWRSPPPPKGEIFTPFLRLAGNTQGASIAPDGETVYYTLADTGNGDIYSIRSGSAPVRLTNHESAETSPVCSRNGKSLAFLRSVGGEMSSIRIMDPSGGPSMAIAEGEFRELAWAPDSRTLVVSQFGVDRSRIRLTAIDTESREWRDLTSPGPAMKDLRPAVAPDASALAFLRLGPLGAAGVFVAELGPGLEMIEEPRLLADGVSEDAQIQWSPDSQDVIFPRDPGGLQQLWRFPKSGASPARVTSAGRVAYHPMVAAGSGRLAFFRSWPVANLWRIDLQSPGGQLVRKDALYPAASRDELPSVSQWSNPPMIAFRAQRFPKGPSSWIGTLRPSGLDSANAADNAREFALPPVLTSVASFCWAGADSYVVTGPTADHEMAAYMVRMGGGYERLPEAGGPVSWISADGKTFLFSSERSGKSEIWMKAPGRPAFPLTSRGGDFALLSPDGKTIYYSKGRDALWRIPFGGGTEELLLRGLTGTYDFAVGTSGVYYISKQKSARIRLRRFEDGGDHEVHRFEGLAGRGLSVSADERTIVFSQYEPLTTEIVILEDFR